MPTTVKIDPASATLTDETWTVDLDASSLTHSEAATLLTGLMQACAEAGGGQVEWWVEDASQRHDRIAESAGLACDRELLLLRCQLPLSQTTTVDTRPFRPGVDDEAWLDVNNRAFDWHPDQGGWTAARLAERVAEPWFDPDGFLLHDDQGRLAGFCWTKVHDDVDPALGEIFVIAVAPDFARHGLGRELTLAGLEYLARRGLTIGMLYVESDNEPANVLYRKLGFEVHQRNRRYVGLAAESGVPWGPSEIQPGTQ